MRKTSWFILLLAVLMIFSVVPAAAADTANLQGYTKAAGYQYVTFGAYPADENGGVQPILWRVLSADGSEAYLLSEYILFPHSPQ